MFEMQFDEIYKYSLGGLASIIALYGYIHSKNSNDYKLLITIKILLYNEKFDKISKYESSAPKSGFDSYLLQFCK